MLFIADERDLLFFRIIMPGIYDIENNREKVLEICNEITCGIKVVKAFVVRDEVWLSIEMFIDYIGWGLFTGLGFIFISKFIPSTAKHPFRSIKF